MSEIYPHVAETYNPLAREIGDEDVSWFQTELQDTPCEMAWLLSPEPELQRQGPLTVREFRDQGLERVLAALQLTDDQCCSIERSTVGQRKNLVFH